MGSAAGPRIVSRRSFCGASAAMCLAGCAGLAQTTAVGAGIHFDVAEYDRARILTAADAALGRVPEGLGPVPPAAKSLPPGTYYSQDPEWWPTEDARTFHPRPGHANPQAFTAHRDALVAMNAALAACVAAWRLTRRADYARHAMRILHAWFLDGTSRMQPQLNHAGCRPDSLDGTLRGVEETVMLAETARATAFLCSYDGTATDEEAKDLRTWFGAFATWLDESKPGFLARESKDRLAICWTLQAAECARFARNESLHLECLHRFREKLLRQMNFDGQFPAELNRPDAYAASIFTLDCMAVLCQALSSPTDRLWDYTLPDGRGMRSAVAFLYPALASRALWKFPADPELFQQLPQRQPCLLLAGRAYGRPEYVDTWKALPADSASPVLLRRMPIREPALWTVRAPA